MWERRRRRRGRSGGRCVPLVGVRREGCSGGGGAALGMGDVPFRVWKVEHGLPRDAAGRARLWRRGGLVLVLRGEVGIRFAAACASAAILACLSPFLVVGLTSATSSTVHSLVLQFSCNSEHTPGSSSSSVSLFHVTSFPRSAEAQPYPQPPGRTPTASPSARPSLFHACLRPSV